MEKNQHLQELAAYRFTVENLRARVAELEAQLAAVQQGLPATKSGRQVIVDSGALQMVLNALERDALEGKQVRAEMRLELMQSITHPTQQGLAQDAERYRMMRDRAEFLDNDKHCIFERDGWEIHGLLYGNDLDMVIDAAIAAQAKQGEQANGAE